MKSRFAPVKRPLLALMAVATVFVATGLTPARAIGHNNLSFTGTMGKIRVRPVHQLTSGATALQQGDPNNEATNPNRTVGDVPTLAGTSFAADCGLGADCLRTVGVNTDPSINPSAADGHTHYHAGDKFLVVNEIAGIRVGDTLTLGSPYCNFPYLGLTCKAFKPGLGTINEQPNGEVVHVVGFLGSGGGPDDHGVGVIELADGLQNDHLDGEQLVKLPTLYQGQQARVDVPHIDLLNCALDPITFQPVSCHGNDVTVRAYFIPPQGSHDPAFPRRPIALSRETQNGPFATSVASTCGLTPCGAGFTSFFIPSNITGTATIGKGFSVDTPDTWYTVLVEARDTTTNAIVADGVSRFKLNPVAITNLKAENPREPGNSTFFPTESVEISGVLKDNTSARALASRTVEDVVVDVSVKKPDGSTSRFQTRSCSDTDPGTRDACGGDVFGATPNGHGVFYVQFGGPMGMYLHLSRGTCNGGVGGCVDAVFSMLDTLDTGSYDVTASLRGFNPAVTATTTFLVEII